VAACYYPRALRESITSTVRALLGINFPNNNMPVVSASIKRAPTGPGTIKQQQQSAAVHIVRVKVLGLAGVVVNNSQNEKTPSLSPEQMKAAIILTRDGRVVGNANSSSGWASSNLSLPLCRSANGDVVTPRDDVSFSGATKASRRSTFTNSSLRMQQKDAEQGAVEISHAGSTRSTERYLAVWDGAKASTRDGATADGEDEPIVLEFETPLARTESTSRAKSTIQTGVGDASIASLTTSRFAPKSFNVGVALSPSISGIDATYAYPLGAASLTIIGDDAACGERVIDLPVLSTAATRPMVGPGSSSKEKKMVDLQTGRDVKSLREMEKRLSGVFAAAASISDSTSKVGKKKSKSPIKKLLSKKSKGDAKKTGTAAMATPKSQIEAFPEKFTIDPSGDAVLRLSVEVYPKPEPVPTTGSPASATVSIATPTVAVKSKGSRAKITVISEINEELKPIPSMSTAGRPVMFDQRNPSDEMTEAASLHPDINVTVDTSEVTNAIIQRGEDEATVGSASKGEPSLGNNIESKGTGLTGETGTVGTGTIGDGTAGETIGTDGETAASIKMTSSFVNRFTSEVVSMAREAQVEGEKTGKVLEAYFDTFILAACRPVPKDEDGNEKSDALQSPSVVRSDKQSDEKPRFQRNSSNNSPRGVDGIDGCDGVVNSPCVGEKITNALTCGVSSPSIELIADNGKAGRFVDRTPPPKDQRPPREIVPKYSDIGSIGELTENTYEYYTKRTGATSRARSMPYDSKNQEKYGMNCPGDLTIGEGDNAIPFPMAINTSMCDGICSYEEAKKFGQEI